MLIGGEWKDSANGAVSSVLDPSNDDVIAEVPRATKQDAKAAIESAKIALESALLHLARKEVADPFARALAELGGHLPADGLDPGLDAELRDPRAHRSEPDDADLANLSRHGRRSYRSKLHSPRTVRRNGPHCSLELSDRACCQKFGTGYCSGEHCCHETV